MSSHLKLNEWVPFNGPPIDGPLIGVEIEVEGTNLPRDMARTGWSIHEDGSLRGESAEYVFSKPVDYERANKILEKFAEKISVATEISMSYRTSVHVHVNVRDMTFTQIYNMILLYTLYEDQFGQIAGDHRIGNLFCLRMSDAKGYLDILRKAARDGRWNNLNSSNLRYSACNPVSMFRHGTLEFRAMRGTTDINLIRRWYTLLLRLRYAATDLFQNPQKLVETLQRVGIERFTETVFNEHPFPYDDQFTVSINDHIPMLEFVAYAQDWTTVSVINAESVIQPQPSDTHVSTWAEVEQAAEIAREAIRQRRAVRAAMQNPERP